MNAAAPAPVRFDIVVPCAECGAAWEVEVVADVTMAAPGVSTVTDRQVWGILRGGSRDTDCGCEHAPRDAHGLMAARNGRDGDEVEARYFDAAAAAVRGGDETALRPAA